MDPIVQSNSPRRTRRLVFMTLFALLVAGASMAVWTSGNAADPQANVPTGSTIPPGGTIPPPDDVDPDLGQVNVLHVAPIAADLIDTGVQICDTDGTTVSDYLYYQQQTGYQTFAPGTYDWYVGLAGDDCQTVVLDIPSFNVGAGSRLLLIIFGDGDKQPLDSTLVVERAGSHDYFLPIINKN